MPLPQKTDITLQLMQKIRAFQNIAPDRAKLGENTTKRQVIAVLSGKIASGSKPSPFIT